MDDTGYELNATMWGEICSMEINQGQIIAVKGAGVSEYGGKSLNLSNDSSLIQVDPEEEPRFHVLKKWYAQFLSGDQKNVEKLTRLGESAIDINSLPVVTIAQIKKTLNEDEQFQSGQSTQGKVFKTIANCSIVKGNNDRPLHYTCCPKPDCKKKVTIHGMSSAYHCEKCDRVYEYCKYAWNFAVKLEDFSDSVYP